MKSFASLAAGLFLGVCGLLGAVEKVAAADDPLAWPEVTTQAKPHAYWWWMASAVDTNNIAKSLARYRDAGMGGVHIIPIYGAKGWESNYISYLSPRWMEMLNHTVTEAKRLDLGVDMTTGSGWCFGGGPYVGEREGNASVVVKTFAVAAGARLAEKFDSKQTQALVAFPNSRSNRGAPAQTLFVELTSQILPDGSVAWTAPAGGAKVYAISQKLNAQKVKRSAPGGEGPMLNLIYPVLNLFFPGMPLADVARAMINSAKNGAPRGVLEVADIRAE